MYAQDEKNTFFITCLESCVKIQLPHNDIQEIQWYNVNGFSSSELTPKVCKSGVYTANYKKDNLWHADTVSVVEKKEIPTAIISGEPSLSCLFDCRTLKGNNPGNNFGATWYGPNGLVINQPEIKVCDAGFYTYRIFKGNCESKAIVDVKNNKTIAQADAGADLVLNCKTPFHNLNPVAPGSEYKYEWFNQDEKLISTQLRPRIDKPGKYYFKVKKGVCVSIDSLQVTSDFAVPKVSSKPIYKISCKTNIAQTEVVCATPQVSYEWKNQQNKIVSDVLSPAFTNSGDYTLKSYSEVNGCSDLLRITVLPKDSIIFTYTAKEACANEPNGIILIDKITGGQLPYLISAGNKVSAERELKGLTKGKYPVTVIDNNGCEAQAIIEIQNQENFEWTLAKEYHFCSYDKPLEIDATIKDIRLSDAEYLWSDGLKTPKRTFTKADYGWVEVKSKCYSDKKYFTIKDDFDVAKNAAYYSPNIINPLSHQAANRCFKPYLGFDVLTYQLRIFDRWGNIVFQTNNPDDCWEATFGESTIGFGTFFWQVNANIDACGYPLPWQKTGGISVFSME